MHSVLKLVPETADATIKENDIQSFVCKHGLGPHIETALQLIAEHFNGPAVAMKRMQDQEIADEWVSLHVNVSGEVNAILDNYDAFTRGFVANVPRSVIGKIRLSLGNIGQQLSAKCKNTRVNRRCSLQVRWIPSMFCEQCALLTRRLIYDPAAEPRAELIDVRLLHVARRNQPGVVHTVLLEDAGVVGSALADAFSGTS